MKAYVGVTGITTVQELKAVEELYDRYGPQSHQLMIGILANQSTAQGKVIQNPRYPDLPTLKKITQECSEHTFNMIHYWTANPKSPYNLVDQMRSFRKILNKSVGGLQYNITWPSIQYLREIKKLFSNVEIVFQLNAEMLQENLPLIKVRQYGKCIDRILIDPSGGQGITFDLKALDTTLTQASALKPLVIAGGFGDTTTHTRIIDIAQRLETTQYSIDAEGKLRTNDVLDLNKVKQYFIDANKGFTEA